MARKLIATVRLRGTNKCLRQLYKAFNNAYYNDTLDDSITVRFSDKPMRNIAEYRPVDEEIVISSFFKPYHRLTIWLLLHEMSHISTGVRGNHHGKVFDQEQFRIALMGAFHKIW